MQHCLTTEISCCVCVLCANVCVCGSQSACQVLVEWSKLVQTTQRDVSLPPPFPSLTLSIPLSHSYTEKASNLPHKTCSANRIALAAVVQPIILAYLVPIIPSCPSTSTEPWMAAVHHGTGSEHNGRQQGSAGNIIMPSKHTHARRHHVSSAEASWWCQADTHTHVQKSQSTTYPSQCKNTHVRTHKLTHHKSFLQTSQSCQVHKHTHTHTLLMWAFSVHVYTSEMHDSHLYTYTPTYAPTCTHIHACSKLEHKDTHPHILNCVALNQHLFQEYVYTMWKVSSNKCVTFKVKSASELTHNIPQNTNVCNQKQAVELRILKQWGCRKYQMFETIAKIVTELRNLALPLLHHHHKQGDFLDLVEWFWRLFIPDQIQGGLANGFWIGARVGYSGTADTCTQTGMRGSQLTFSLYVHVCVCVCRRSLYSVTEIL